MAKSTSKPRNVRQFPKNQPDVSAENGVGTEVLDHPGEPETPFDASPAEAQAEAAAEPEKPKKTPKNLTFFERLQTISRKEWEGDRAKIKVYRLAPVINRLVSSDHKYITMYDTPITEDQLKRDHGSGRYRLYLNYKAPGQKEAEIDRIELDILDPKYPPNIPGNEWLDDPRNKAWQWAKPAGAPGYQTTNGQPQQQAAADPFAALDTFMNIQDRIEERLKPADAAPMAATAAPAPVDPWAAAEKILNMRADNPMMAILQEQMKLNAAAAEAERARNYQAQEAARDREHKLQMQLLEAKMSGGQGKPFFEQLLEFASNDKLEPIKKLLNLGGNGAGETVRAARTTPLELAREFITSPMGASIGMGVSSLLSQMMQPRQNGGPPQQYPTVINQQNPNGTAAPIEPPEQRIQRIGAQITRPLITNFMRGGAGSDFAQSMFDLNPEDYVFMRQLGAENIVHRYRQFPDAWNAVQFREADFIEFIRDFCAWNPDEDEGPTPPGNGDDGVNDGIVDLESQEAGS